MDMTPVKPERKAQLEAYARLHGQSVVDALDDLLAAQLKQQANEEPELSPDAWVRELEAWGERNAPKDLPVLSNEALRRESLYEDRGM